MLFVSFEPPTNEWLGKEQWEEKTADSADVKDHVR